MTALMTTDTEILIPDAPAIPGLRFRRFRGEADYPHMVAILNACNEADGLDEAVTLEEVRATYEHLRHSDPGQDMVFVEVDGQTVGYSRVMWWQEDATRHRIYFNFGSLIPQWRRKGIGGAVHRHNERRLREIAADHPRDGERFFQSGAVETNHGATALLLNNGYHPVAYGALMVRPDYADIPEAPLPPGLEVRPVREEHLRPIWEAEVEAFRDHWGFSRDMEDFNSWLADPESKDRHLWQVAWDGDQVVGMVRNFISEAENAKFNRLRGYTEHISTRRAWRRQGVARALLCMSLRMFRDMGLQEAALGVHTENPNGAYQLYESMGFRVVQTFIDYRKPLD